MRIEEGEEAISGAALVTGASSGLGEAFAHELAARGYAVVLVSEDEVGLERVRRDIAVQHDAAVHVLVEDLAAPGAARRLWQRCLREQWSVEVLINCAGVFLETERELRDPRSVQGLLALHVQAPTGLCLRLGAEMLRRGRGYILNVASISALFPDPSSLSYGPSKRYLLAFSKNLHLAWRDQGVRVCCLIAGGLRTGFFARNDVYVPGFVLRHLCPPRDCARRALAALLRGRPRVVVPALGARRDILLFRLLLVPPLHGIFRRLYLRLRERSRGRGTAQSEDPQWPDACHPPGGTL